MEVLKDLRLRSVVADHDKGERQRCNESEREVESDWENQARAIWAEDVVANGDEGERQRWEMWWEWKRGRELRAWESEARVGVLFESVPCQNDAVAI